MRRSACRSPSRRPAAAARASACSGSRGCSSGVSRVSRVPKAKTSTPRPSAPSRGGTAAAPGCRPPSSPTRRTARRACAASRLRRRKRRCDRVPARGDRAARQRAHVEDVSAAVGLQPARAPRGRALATRGDQLAGGGELLGASSRRSPCGAAPRAALVPISSGSPSAAASRPACASRRMRWARWRGRRGSASRRLGGADGLAQEPGVERAVEVVELLAPRDERRAQRPVDVVLPGDVDAVEAAQRVGEAPRPDLAARPRAARGRR